jgi:uncharacterized membrane protein
VRIQTEALTWENTMEFYDGMKYVHIALGVMALITFWLSGFSRKGSKLHTGSGKIYLLAMTGILISSSIMIVLFSIRPKPPGEHFLNYLAMFLGYLVVITSTSVWCSWRAIRDKKDWLKFTGPVYKALMFLNALSGLIIAYVGLFETDKMALIFVGFSLIGLNSAWGMWRFARTPPGDPRWWLKQHFGSMIGNGVATHIAFLSIGLPKLLPMLSGPLLQNLAWLGPLSLSVLAGIYLNRKYMPAKKPVVTGITTP